MEFKYRAGDSGSSPTPKQTSIPPCPAPVSTIIFFSDQSLRATIPGPRPNVMRIPASNVTAGEAMLREMEKARIRREIIAAEVARRVQLEEEVRREMALERGWMASMPRNLGAAAAAAARGLSPFDKRPAMLLDSAGVGPFNVPKPPLPQLMAPPEMLEHHVENNKDKVIVLSPLQAKPDPDLYAAKRKVVTPPVDGREHLQKKPKAEWSCALCKVSATSERGLNDHLNGRKHKAKEASLKPPKVDNGTSKVLSSKKRNKIAAESVKSTQVIVPKTTPELHAKADWQPLQPQPLITGGKDRDQTVGESKNEAQLLQNNHIEALESEGAAAKETGSVTGRVNGPKGNKAKFWCEICQVGAQSPAVFMNHKFGRRHLNRMKKLGGNCGSSSQTVPASQEADTIIDVKEESITDPAVSQAKLGIDAESFYGLDKVSPVAAAE